MIEPADGLHKVNKSNKQVLVLEDKDLLNKNEKLILEVVSTKNDILASKSNVSENYRAVVTVNFDWDTAIYVIKVKRENGTIIYPDTFITPLVYVKEEKNLIFKNLDL